VSGRVTIQLPARRGRRRGRCVGADIAPGAPDAASAPTRERVPRVARVLALAHHWQGLIRSGAVRDQADLARLVGVSRARVTQIMSLLWLAPHIQEAVLTGMICATGEQALRKAASQRLWSKQRTPPSAGSHRSAIDEP
jgi:hypothetical protein